MIVGEDPEEHTGLEPLTTLPAAVVTRVDQTVKVHNYMGENAPRHHVCVSIVTISKHTTAMLTNKVH